MVETYLFLLFFSSLALAALVAAVKIHLNQTREAHEIERLRLDRIESFRAKCHRPDGD